MKKFTGFAAALICAAMSFSLLGCENPASSSSDPEPASQNGNSTPAATTPAPATYTVTYADGIDELEISVPSDTAQHTSGSTVTVNFTVGNRVGYTFTGWSDGTNTYTSNGTSSFTISSNVTLTAQWQWANSYIGTKAPSEAKEVGDIVFNDNSAMSYSDFSTRLVTADKNSKKTSAIALIFYKGTELNSGSDTTTSRTLGVGLKHSEANLSWCTINAPQYETAITDIYCKASGDRGAYTFNHATENDRNGKNNFEVLSGAMQRQEYPAFNWTYNYLNQKIGTETTSRVNNSTLTSIKANWYLPTVAEMFWIYKNGKSADKIFDLDAASEALGGDRFDSDTTKIYWTSTQENSSNDSNQPNRWATMFSVNTGGIDSTIKSSAYMKACAIHEF